MTAAMVSKSAVATTRDRRMGYWSTVAVFLVLAYGLSWWPALGRLANPEAAVVIPIGPSIAALVVVGWVAGRQGRRQLLASLIDFRGVRRVWPTLLVPPAIGAVSVGAHLASGGSIPQGGDIGSSMLILAVLPLTAIVGGPLGEELGWRGLLLPHLLQRYSALTATMVLIPMWLLFHLPLSIAEPDRYGLLWALNVVGIAVTMTWVYLRSSRSVLAAVVFHAVANSSTGAAVLLFPEHERNVPWAIATSAWLLIAAVVAAGPLRHEHSDRTAIAPSSLRRPHYADHSKGTS